VPYLPHFGLDSHPFALTPNTAQYFPTSGNTQVLQSLAYGVGRNAGIMKVVGDVGTGKTLLCRLLLRQIEDEAEVAYLNAPQAEGDALIALVCHEFGLETGDRAQMLQALNAFLLDRHAEGRDCVLVVDEAQALGPEGLETVRLLSNLETETAKLLQIILFGQTELDDLLARPALRQINQRIAFSFTTGPFTPAEARSYIAHRLRVCRVAGVDYEVFLPKAVDRLIEVSGAVPRVINILCDKALLIAYSEGARAVTRQHVDAAIKDSPTLVAPGRAPRRRGRTVAAVLGGVMVGAAAAAAALALTPAGDALGEWLSGTSAVTGSAAPPAAEDTLVDTVAGAPPAPVPAAAAARTAGRGDEAVAPEVAAATVPEPTPVPEPPPSASPGPAGAVAAMVTPLPKPAAKPKPLPGPVEQGAAARLADDGKWVWE